MHGQHWGICQGADDVYLDLIDLWRPDLGVIFHLVDVANTEIADADAPCFLLLD